MADELNRVRRRVQEPFRSLSRPLEKKFTQAVEKPFRTGASAAAREAETANLTQQQLEKARLTEAEGEIARRRGLAGSRTGRQSLIRSSPSGLATNLGGT